MALDKLCPQSVFDGTSARGTFLTYKLHQRFYSVTPTLWQSNILLRCNVIKVTSEIVTCFRFQNFCLLYFYTI